MPNRIIKESICTSDSVDRMTWFEECFWQRLIVNCDDYGRFDARASVLKSRLFPLRDQMPIKDIEKALLKLCEVGCIILYEVDGKPYLLLPSWESHQTIRAKRSKYPAPVDNLQTSEIICKQMQADECICSRNPIQSESESESNPIRLHSADKPRRFTKPTIEDITAYCKERGNAVEAQRFYDFYEAKGWYIGKNPMKDWKAAVRTWEQSEKRNGAAGIEQPSKPPEQERRKFYYTDTDGKVKEGVR